MMKTTNDVFRFGDTARANFVDTVEVATPVNAVATMTTTRSSIEMHYVRAQYVAPSAGKQAQVIATVNTKQAGLKAAIRGINAELQGQISAPSSTAIG